MEEQFDLIAVGGGLAGLSAAARAAQLGARVAVIEKGEQADYPCNSRFSGGVIHVAQNDVKLPEAELREIAAAATQGYVDPELLEIMVVDTRRALDWLRSCGANFVRGYGQNWVMAPPRPFVNHIVWKGLGTDRTLSLLARIVTEKAGQMLLGHRAEELIMEDGICRGVVALRGKDRVTLRSRATIIADGGFQANAEMFRKYIGPNPDKVFRRNAGNGTGDGLRMAMAIGAATTELNRFYGHLLSIDAFTNQEVWPYPQIDRVAAAGIIVDRSGKRLLDEGLGGIYAANHLATLPDPTCGIVICDTPAWAKAGMEGQGPIPPLPRLEKAGGTLFKADSIEALASKAGITPEGLTQTVASYNATIKDGKSAGLTPPKSNDRGAPTAISTAPFIAIPVCVGITNTMGGLAIDIHGRVKNAKGGTVAGLYAAGAATGGLEGGPKVVYVGGLCRALLFGMRAAEHAVNAKAE